MYPEKEKFHPDAIMIHTYCPKKSIVPKRGIDVISRGLTLAVPAGCPVILTVGKTVPGENRTESAIYRDFIINEAGSLPSQKIIIGTDENAIDSKREIQEANRICREKGFHNLIIVALEPHWKLRLKKDWDKVNRDGFYTLVPSWPEIYQERYWIWEILMFAGEFFLPPNSIQRKIALWLMRRKG